MAGKRRVAIVFNRVGAGAPPQETDVLVQVNAVRNALAARGYDCELIPADLDLESLRQTLGDAAPDVVFNLVEALGGSDRLCAVAPALLEHAGVPFTGAPAVALFITTCKPTAKSWLRSHALPTPDWWRIGDDVPADLPCIVKSAWEHASLGLDDLAVVTGPAAAARRLAECTERWGGEWFVERFVAGREFNVALLAGPGGPVVLPLAEILFEEFPAGKAHIIGWQAKWDEASFESRHTPREFIDEAAERELSARLRKISMRCWDIFGLRGYARVDFRVDAAGNPWVLEVNANPCLAPDAGFAAALERADIAFPDAVERIVADAGVPGAKAQ